MIDEKKLIGELQNHKLEYKDSDVGIGINVVKEIIKNQPKIDDWIPCSDDNLPEKEVLCCDRYGEMMFGYVFKTEEGTYNAESEHEYMYDCVAWAEKPEPYKENKEE